MVSSSLEHLCKQWSVFMSMRFDVRVLIPQVVSLLLERGADVNAIQDMGWSSLMMASARGHIDVSSQADPRFVQSISCSILHLSYRAHECTSSEGVLCMRERHPSRYVPQPIFLTWSFPFSHASS
jgi:hypothetical protein